ncbi:hypothetical protein C0Q70_03303 [Pomacea canaliculata]|uniref:RING-type domain-containing protein n=1 Tax=Pomacea canaliculata TaxID=400727 RepID=A0A2T7PSC8_POMCA|nr:hypothetical protein C0Q70_03303 [Pomacea canaliculata]
MNPQSVVMASAKRRAGRGTATVGKALPAQTNRHRECALCLEKLKSPRILPCFHTFCLQCLTGLVDNQQRKDSFPCPTCRTKIDIPPGGVSKFQVNFYIEAETCKSIICRDCKLTSHEGHPSCDLSSMAAKGKQFLSSICKMFEDSLEPKLREELSSAQDQQNKWVKNVEVVRQQLMKGADDVKKAVDLSLNQALRKLEDDTKDVKYEVDKAIEEMQQQMACCQSLFEHAKRVAEKGVDADILDLPSQLESFFEIPSSDTGCILSGQVPQKLAAFIDGKWRWSVEWFQPNSFSGREDLKTYVTYYIGDIKITNPQQTGHNMHHQNTYNGRFGNPRKSKLGYFLYDRLIAATSDASATVKEEQPVRTHRHQECALCLEKFKSPRILPCFHTFCLQCLTGVVDNQQGTDSFPCPTCRTKIDIPPGGVSKFQVNFYIEAEVDAESLMSQPLACATGCTMAATHKCFECDQLMCDYCKRVHGTIPTCKSIICRDCKLTSHEGHPSCDLSSMADSGKQLLSNIRRMFDASLEPKLKEELRAAHEHQNNWNKKVEEIRKELLKRADDIKKIVYESLTEELTKLNQEAQGVKSEIDATVEEMEQQLACCQSLFEHAERVAENGVDADILDLPSKLGSFFEMHPPATYRNVQNAFHEETHKLTAFTGGKWRRSLEWFQPTHANLRNISQQVKHYIGQIRRVNLQHTVDANPFQRVKFEAIQRNDILSLINDVRTNLTCWNNRDTKAAARSYPPYGRGLTFEPRGGRSRPPDDYNY